MSEEELEAGTTESTKQELKGPGSRPKVRIDKLLRDAAASTAAERTKRVQLRFLTRPIEFLAHPSDPTRLGSVLCERTELTGEPGTQVAVPTGETFEIPAAMALISVGYRGIPLPGMDETIFDETKGTVRNDHGKVAASEKDTDDTNNLGRLYVCGWLKRGPSGIIGTNIADAKDTVASILRDLTDPPNASPSPATTDGGTAVPNRCGGGREGLDRFLEERGVETVNWDGYLRIDAMEREVWRRRTEGQPREKFTEVEEMLDLARDRQG